FSTQKHSHRPDQRSALHQLLLQNRAICHVHEKGLGGKGIQKARVELAREKVTYYPHCVTLRYGKTHRSPTANVADSFNGGREAPSYTHARYSSKVAISRQTHD